MVNWKYCQKNSDLILASGLKILKQEAKTTFEDLYPNEYGNYLICDKTTRWNYIGEAKNLSNRIRQHSKERTSTFYKNYRRLGKDYPNLPRGLQIEDFKVRTVLTNIGRKEIEEFGIVNIPANLNKFQKGKRQKYLGNTDQEFWNEVQTNFTAIIEQGETELLKAKGIKWFDAQVKSTAGLYWVEHTTRGLLYIGESSNISDRYVTHSGRTYFSALRRHIGENLLGFQLQTRKGKKRFFKDLEDDKVTGFLRKCTIKTLSVNFGRFELEEYLIRKHKPLLNRKDNR